MWSHSCTLTLYMSKYFHPSGGFSHRHQHMYFSRKLGISRSRIIIRMMSHYAHLPPWSALRIRFCWLYYGLPQLNGEWQPSSIFFKTPMRVAFSKAAATLSLSDNWRVTASAVLCVPSLIFTSTLNRGGRACSRRTRTPRPITVAREQWVMVGVIRTVTTLISSVFRKGAMWISGRLTTEREPNVSGCSGSTIEEMRSTNKTN